MIKFSIVFNMIGKYMKLSKKVASLLLTACAVSTAALADVSGTIYTQLGTNGLGLGYAKSVTQDFALRGQVNSYSRAFTGNVGDFGATAQTDVNFSLKSVQLMADWYPTASGFRMTGGVVLNDNKITVQATNASINGTAVDSASAEIKLSKSMSPYVGIGYSTRPLNAKGWGFNVDLGLMIQDPSVTLTTSSDAVTDADIEAQKAKVLDALSQLKNMPVLGLGVSYSF
jgi:hypothetical protein